MTAQGEALRAGLRCEHLRVRWSSTLCAPSLISCVLLEAPKPRRRWAADLETGLQNAAFINGTTAEAIEAQDGLRFGGNHPVSAVIPASFVVCGKHGFAGHHA
ncbi:MAG: hypothetical protein MZU91_08670 [Desulfosudis oleivorans]|nr:hypothetical protein [Desulfosudis oleivorans]